MRVLSQQQAQELDKIAMMEYDISGEKLMGNAGEKIANFVQTKLINIHSPKIGIVCGKGHNGGDGFAAGSILKESGYDVVIYSLIEKNDITGDSLVFHNSCLDQEILIYYSAEVPESLPEFDLMIDAILGTGFSGDLKRNIEPWSLWLNASKITISVDIPTGVNSNTGVVSTIAVKADHTITMGLTKLGMLLEPGKSHCGEIHPLDIGFPNIVQELRGRKWHQLTEEKIQSMIKPLEITTHKHRQGKVLIVAGSIGMTGAAYLSTLATLRSGAGLAITCAPRSLNSIYEQKITEGMSISCEDNDKGFFTESNYDMIMDHVDWCDSLVIGPGLGSNGETAGLVTKLVKTVNKPMVLDADGLRPFYNNLDLFRDIKSKFVITPHLGEFSQLTGIDSQSIQNNLPVTIDKFMDEFQGVLLLKYSPSIVAWESKGCVNSTGNPGLATAGSGDVLTGIVAAFIAQGIDTQDAAKIGMYIHGKAGDQLAKSISQHGMIASDLLYKVGRVLSNYEL